MHRLALCLAFYLSLYLLPSCTQSGSTEFMGPSQGGGQPAVTVPGPSQAPQSAADLDLSLLAERPGLRQYSGRLIARPLQTDSPAAIDMDPQVLLAHQGDARQELSRFRIRRVVQSTGEYLIDSPPGASDPAICRQLIATGHFEYVEPDWIVFPIACPNDTLFPSQWHHQTDKMQSCEGWTLHTGNPSVSVGICDTGVLVTHEDLQLHRLEGYNAVDRLWESQGGNIGPVNPHGTETTGCAAANGNNGVGVSGVGWNLSFRMLRVSNSPAGTAFISDLQHAARTSIQNGDRVASVSFSGADTASNLTTATFIKSIGGLMVWAAGNDARFLTFGDRDADDLIVAGASDQTDARALFSAFGPFVDVMAPGVSVLTTGAASNNAYLSVSGTSFSTPLTAGLCALIWSANPGLTPDQVEAILKQSTNDLGAVGVDDIFGYGRINVFGAMQLAVGAVPPPPPPPPTPTPPVADFTGTPTSGVAPLTVSFTDLSTNTPTTWAWDFGDGGSSSIQASSHVYTAAGAYSVSLTASNADGSGTLARTSYINVTDPVAPIIETLMLSKNADFSTNDSSFTTADTLFMRVRSDRVDFNQVKKSEWELADPNGRKTKQKLTGQGDGTYLASVALSGLPSGSIDWTLSVILQDRAGVSFNPSAAITVSAANTPPPPPTLTSISATPVNAVIVLGQSQQFTATGSFSDGSTADLSSTATWTSSNAAVATIDASGRATGVTVGTAGITASQGGVTSLAVSLGVTAVPPPPPLPTPIADFIGSPLAGTAPLMVNFSDLSSGVPTAWVWDFGDGSSSTLQSPSHLYQIAGTYTVTLTTSNAQGSDIRVRANYIAVANSGDFTGEGFVLSKNADFSTDDRIFTSLDTLYIRAWSDLLDRANMKKIDWELNDPNGGRVRSTFTNVGNGSFTASIDLASLSSSIGAWTWSARLEDGSGNKFKPSAMITVQ